MAFTGTPEEIKQKNRDAQVRHRLRKQAEQRAADIASGKLVRIRIPGGDVLEVKLRKADEAVQ